MTSLLLLLLLLASLERREEEVSFNYFDAFNLKYRVRFFLRFLFIFKSLIFITGKLILTRVKQVTAVFREIKTFNYKIIKFGAFWESESKNK